MRRIRNSLFETNSSSVHAICIAPGAYEVDRKILKCVPGKYGWEFRRYSDANDKASYLISTIHDSSDKDLYIQQLHDALEKHGVTLKISDNDDCYIDHDYNWGNQPELIINNEDCLMRFLFNDESYVVTGNDNDDRLSKMISRLNKDKDNGCEVFKKGN